MKTPPTPKFVLNTTTALKQYGIVENIADIISYSSKTNPQLTPILEQKTQCLFSIHFQAELAHVTDMSRVFFLAQAWSKKEIRELLQRGVKRFCVDNEQDLDLFLSELQENPCEVELFLRLQLKERSIRTEKYYVFGMTSATVNARVQEIATSSLQQYITTLGVHVHRKTQNMAEWNLQRELQDSLTPQTLSTLQVINIGGGLPSTYANTNKAVFKGIYQKIANLRDFFYTQNIKLMIEPGRFISAPSIQLHTTIIGKHNSTLIVNASVYNSDMDALIVPVKLLVAGEQKEKQPNNSSYVIKGITPCSLDIFRYKVYLPPQEIGDTIIFENAGAYNFTTNFCDLPLIPTEVR